MAWLGTLASTVLRNVFTDIPPNQVTEVRTSEYHKRHIYCREDSLVLYNPASTDRKTQKYEIILHRPCTETLHHGYSLYRSEILEEAETHFLVYKDKIPIIMNICREMSNLTNLQRLCDTLVQHPSWNLAHICAFLLLYDAFKHDAIKTYINSLDSESGASPLQIAITTSNLKIVQTLIAAKSSLEHLDYKANTVFHYASNTTKDIILALGSDFPCTLNSRNSDGYTPMHLACLSDKPDCVKALLLIGADVNISATEGTASTPGYVGDFLHNQPYSLKTEDMKFGGTPLHWSCSREVMNTLIEKNCDINALNFDGRTALHIMVIKKRLQCVAALLSHMANINIVDREGDSPLHVAVANSTPSIVQLLIAFGSEIDSRNFKGETPRHLCKSDSTDGQKILYLLHAVGAQRCSPDTNGCHIGCKQGENFDGIAPPEPPTAVPRTVLDQMLYVSSMEKMASSQRPRPAKGGRLLCLDGGGIKGLVLVQTLLEIEAVLGKPIITCFDWIAGTSTGGILALGIASGKGLRECQALYLRIKDSTFIGKRPYPSEPLEKTLKETLGESTVMSDIRHPKVMITGVLADRKPVDLHLFRNYDSPSKILNIKFSDKFKETQEPEQQLIWKVARATGAAPSYFRAFGRFLDGGLIANNPTLDAMTEIHEYNLALEAVNRESQVVPLSFVVSIGTGAIPVSVISNLDVYRPEGLFDAAKLMMGLTTLATLLVDQATAADGRVVDRARTWCSMIGVPFYRFNPQLSAEVAMDESSDEVLAEMMWTAKAFMHANRDQIIELGVVLSSLEGTN